MYGWYDQGSIYNRNFNCCILISCIRDCAGQEFIQTYCRIPYWLTCGKTSLGISQKGKLQTLYKFETKLYFQGRFIKENYVKLHCRKKAGHQVISI